jgi:hypothetical protein
MPPPSARRWSTASCTVGVATRPMLVTRCPKRVTLSTSTNNCFSCCFLSPCRRPAASPPPAASPRAPRHDCRAPAPRALPCDARKRPQKNLEKKKKKFKKKEATSVYWTILAGTRPCPTTPRTPEIETIKHSAIFCKTAVSRVSDCLSLFIYPSCFLFLCRSRHAESHLFEVVGEENVCDGLPDNFDLFGVGGAGAMHVH